VTVTGPGLKKKSKKLKKLKGGKLKLPIAPGSGLLASTPPGATVAVKLRIKFRSVVAKKPRVKKKTVILVR